MSDSDKCILESNIYFEMKQKLDIAAFKPIDKGLSGDRKFYIQTSTGEQFLLRISNADKYEVKKNEFQRMILMAEHEIPMCTPIEFGISKTSEFIYMLLEWCDGENLENAIHKISHDKQYELGIQAGKILSKIHNVPVHNVDISENTWDIRYRSFMDESIKSFQSCNVSIDNADKIIDYFINNSNLLKSRSQCYIHGDYHLGNMMLCLDKVKIIDWEIHLYNCYGDPWLDITMQETPHFSTGLIDGYFGEKIPQEFWHVLKLYSSISAISSVPWAYYCYPEELDSRILLCKNILHWYDNMKGLIPSWYILRRN